MALRFLIVSRLLARLAGALISSDSVLKASRRLMGTLKKEYGDIPDTRLKDHLVNLDFRIEKVEAEIRDLKKSIKNAVVAIYIIGAAVVIALVLAVVKVA